MLSNSPAANTGKKHHEYHYAQVREIRTEFAKLNPVKITPDDKRSLTVKEALRALTRS